VRKREKLKEQRLNLNASRNENEAQLKETCTKERAVEQKLRSRKEERKEKPKVIEEKS